MKKNNITQLIILLLPNILWFTSCYEDKSSFVTTLIPEVQISINDKNQENSIYVGYQSPVDIVPSITQDGFDSSNLRYEWAVTEEPSTTNPVYEIIGTEKDFHGIINRPISNGAYTLKLIVTDVANDNLQYFYSWKLYVQSSFLDGLLVADSENGTTTDFTLINNSQITNRYTKEERIFRHILETANGTTYDGLLTSLTYEIMGNAVTVSSHLNQIWAISSTGKSVRFNCEDYSINGTWEDEKLFLYCPTDFQVRSYIRSSQLFIAYTNNGLYSFLNTAGNKFSMPNSVFNGFEINNNVYAANSSYEISDNHLVWLDKSKGAFYSLNGTSYNTCTPYISNPEFDPNDMGSQTAIAATSSQDGSLTTFLLKDDNSGDYAIYTLSQYKAEIENRSNKGEMWQ